jgi:hypothetical protein
MCLHYIEKWDVRNMSIKKELLNELTEKQLMELAEHKGVKLALSDIQKGYYTGWNEKDRLVDIMKDTRNITVKDIENFLKLQKDSGTGRF